MIRRSVFLLVVLAACSKKASKEAGGSAAAPGSGSAPAITASIAGEWNVYSTNGMCSANDLQPCPPDVECQPPPPRQIECPAGLGEGTNVRVVELSDKTCAVAPAGCTAGSCLGPRTPCPLPRGEALPSLRWTVTTQPDGTCTASSFSPSTGTSSLTIKCPAAEVPNLVIRRPRADAPCVIEGKSQEVPCPAEPKQSTVAALRDALAKDAAAFKDHRVRIQGHHVASLASSAPSGKHTIYTLGAADTKGSPAPIRCTSRLPHIEVADGDAVIVEGLAKKTTDGIELAECRAWVP
jgi:hypothetical protein